MDVPVVTPEGWNCDEITAGLAALERLRRTLDAAVAVLIGGLGPNGRDTQAAIVRGSGVSTRMACEQAKVAALALRAPEIVASLREGAVSVEHLREIARVRDPGGVTELLAVAVGQSPDEIRATVDRWLIEHDEADHRDKQHAARSVRFFRGEHGCVGMRAVLSPLEGAELRGRLAQIVDAAWRKAHPERASTLGGPDDVVPYDQRLADALMELVQDTAGSSGRPVVVVTVNAETLEADIIGTGPVPLDGVIGFSERADLYAAIRGCEGGALKLGRSRRLASPLQRLAATIRDRRCVIDGCDATPDRCHVHHVHPYENGGCTDLCNLCLLCAKHHRHIHTNGLRLRRDGPRWVTEPKPDPPPPDS